LSHHGGDQEKIATLARLNHYHIQQFAKFVDRMKNTPDGERSLFDNSLLVCGCGMGDSNAHATDPLPTVAVGGLAGRGNRHLVLPEKTPVGNFWVGVAHKFGVDIESHGNSNGVVTI